MMEITKNILAVNLTERLTADLSDAFFGKITAVYGHITRKCRFVRKFSLRFLCHHGYLVPAYTKKPKICNNCKSLAFNLRHSFSVSLFLVSKLMLVSAETIREQWADRLIFMDTLDGIPDKRTNGYLNELVDLLFFRKLDRISNNQLLDW